MERRQVYEGKSKVECLRQAPTQINNLYTKYYIGKEKEFIELLFYIQQNNNLERVLEAVRQLETVRLGHVTTEGILFICGQSGSSEVHTLHRDETLTQSERNMKAYADMFHQSDEGVTHYG